VQGQLEITDRAWCDFVSWTRERMVVLHVVRSRKYWAWLQPLLQQFYSHVSMDAELEQGSRRPPPPPICKVVRLYDGRPPPQSLPPADAARDR